MKNVIKYTAILASLFAALRLLIAELDLIGLMGNHGTTVDWLGALVELALTPLPISNVGGLAGSLSILGILLFLGRTPKKSPTPIHFSPTMPIQEVNKEPQHGIRSLSEENLSVLREQMEEEWTNLEEVDKETVREMVIQGGLWESDMLALLKARGLLYRTTRYDSLADRVSFVQCDYSGYHTILPEYHSFIEKLITADYAEELC